MIDEWDESEVSDLEDEYTLLGELGRGGSAVVYRARDRSLFRDVAIKVVRPKFAATAEEAIARLAREARTVARLSHPNIVTVHAVKRLRDGGLALVMQMVPGRTLKQVIADEGAMSAERCERVLKDVAEALAFAHAHGVVHRDVKPENIFIEAGSGRALLADFGIAHSSEFDSRLTMTGAAIGTPAYMAPEQIDGAPANARSDLYSLGLVAWEMLTGERPWHGEALYNVIFKQKTDNLAAIDEIRPGEIPPRLQYIIERCLQKKPAARWAGADGMLNALNNWVTPSDWKQWEESHRRRREAQKHTPRAVKAVKEPVPDATVRFARPIDGVTPSAPVESVTPTTRSEPNVAAIDESDDAPSWANVHEPKSYARLYVLVGALLILVGGGATAMYAKNHGLFTSRVASTSSLTDKGTVELSVVAQNAANAPVDSTLIRGSAAAARDSADSVLVARGATDSVRVDSIAAARLRREERRATRIAAESAAKVVLVAPTPTPPPVAVEAPRVDAVRSSDDAGVIAAGGQHSCALASNKVLCWGANDRGQLGVGDQESRDAPTPIVSDLDFTQITTGRTHSCAIARGGEANCWGADDKGQLGDATTTSRSAPVRVAGNQSYRVLRAGLSHTCGLTTNGEVTCWGGNDHGQIGDGSLSMRSSPVVVSAGVRYVSVSTGWNHSCGIASDGTAFCWGANANGQIGNGSRSDARTPVAVGGGLHFTSISAGGTHTCAVSTDGEVYCWGHNNFGQLGASSSDDKLTPTKVETSARFASVSVGGVHSCARTRNGQAWCWGSNVYGQLGDGTNTNRDTPTRVIGGPYQTVNATAAHTCAAATDGELQCWGFNVSGQLGDGTRNHRSRPSRVTLPGK